MKKTLALAALPLAATLALTGCGSDDEGSTPAGSGDHSSTSHDMSGGMPTTHNDQDVTFAQQMVPHHQQAIVMAKMAERQATSAQVRQLAQRIEAAQGPEIRTMSGWLEDWGAEDSGMGGMSGTHSMDDMPGMMSRGDLREMMRAHGQSFDRMFLEGMIAHHRGALRMAGTEIARGENPDAVALARSIKTSQTQEIREMQQMLGG